MAGIPWWYQDENVQDYLFDRSRGVTNPWDMVWLNGVLLPGVAYPEVNKGHKLQIKESAGTSGGVTTDQGFRPAEIDIHWMIWTPAQWEKMQLILPKLEPPPTAGYKMPAFSISHPATLVRGITDIVIEKITGPTAGQVHGTRIVKAKCWQYLKPGKASQTNTPGGTITPSAQNALYDRAASDPSTQGTKQMGKLLPRRRPA
jgi:hypothetical protein